MSGQGAKTRPPVMLGSMVGDGGHCRENRRFTAEKRWGQLPRMSGLPFIVCFRYRWSQGYLLAKMGKDQAFQMSGPWWEEYGRWESFSLVTVDIF
jgi:hypothetical protein